MTHHDIRSLRARYRVRIGSTAPSQSVAYMNLYQQLSQNHPVFLKQFVQYLDIPPDEKNELIQSVDLVAQQGSTIQQQEQLIKMLQNTIKNISKENLDLEKRHKVDRFEGMLVKKMAKMEANLSKMMGDLKFKGEKEIQDAKNKIKKSDSSDNNERRFVSMSKQPEMVEVQDDNQALDILGMGDSSSKEPEKPVQPSEPPAAIQQPQEGAVEPQTPQEPPKEDKMSWEDRAKSWQSNFTKTQQELQNTQKELEVLKQQTELFRTVALRNNQPQQYQPPQQVQAPETVEEQEPQLTNYVSDPEYVNVTDPNYQRYVRDVSAFHSRRAATEAINQYQKTQKTQTKREVALTRAKRLANRFPEYRDPFTGEPDLVKIQQDLFADNDDPDEWVRYAEFRKGVKSQQANGKSPQVAPNNADVVDQMNKAASVPSSVVSGTPANNETIEPDDDDKEMTKLFGKSWVPVSVFR